MSCPDWTRLAARRDAEPEGWREAVEHFDGCSLCRREALAADPLLVFRRLPGAEIAAMTPAEERSEVESVCQAVAAMRTASRLESRRSFAGWKRWAAAAVLAGVSLGVGDAGRVHEPEPAAVPPAAWEPASGLPAASSYSAPAALEVLDRPEARVYHVNGEEGFRLSMVVDASLDV